MRALYNKYGEVRQAIIDYILAPPPTSARTTPESTEYFKFEMLSCLSETGIDLPKEATEVVEELRTAHPQWKVREESDEELQLPEDNIGINPQEIRTKKPRDVAHELISRKTSGSFEGYANAIGQVFLEEPHWTLDFLSNVVERIQELPESTFSSIQFGMLRNDAAAASWSPEDVRNLLEAIQRLVEIRKSAELWRSVPWLLQKFQTQIANISMEQWIPLIKALYTLYKNQTEEGHSESWYFYAINHPVGHLLQLCVVVSSIEVKKQSQEGHAYHLPTELKDFYTEIASSKDPGAIYGFCILCNVLGWLEAVDPSWTSAALVPSFKWDPFLEKVLVAWSGYLYGGRLSTFLSQRFKETYLESAGNVSKFTKYEREQLAGHFAALIWFKHIDLAQLAEFAKTSSTELRLSFFYKIEKFLKESEPSRAEQFWKEILINLWDLLQSLKVVTQEELYQFYRLILYSGTEFPNVTKKLLQRPVPTGQRYDRLYWHLEKNHLQLQKESLAEKYPAEMCVFITRMIDANATPMWGGDQLRTLWKCLSSTKVEGLEHLHESLARIGVI
jgi:hypothetical protein